MEVEITYTSQPTDDGVQPDQAAPDLAEENRERVARLTGVTQERLQSHMIHRIAATIGSSALPDSQEDAALLALQTLGGLGPRNLLEGMLFGQMLAANEALMLCSAFAAGALEKEAVRESELRHATRLLQILPRQIDALCKLRTIDLPDVA